MEKYRKHKEKCRKPDMNPEHESTPELQNKARQLVLLAQKVDMNEFKPTVEDDLAQVYNGLKPWYKISQTQEEFYVEHRTSTYFKCLEQYLNKKKTQ